MFRIWQPVIHELKIPVALVAQDGLTHKKVPWDALECVFIGGSTEYKLSRDVAKIVLEAKSRGKMVHAGRVNTEERISHFAWLGADTFDGSGFSKWPKRIAYAIRWVDVIMWRIAVSPSELGKRRSQILASSS